MRKKHPQPCGLAWCRLRLPWDYHPADSRIGIGEPEKIQTLTSRMGTGGNNVPLVMDGKARQELPLQTLKIRSGCEGGGKGAQVQVEKSRYPRLQ